MSWFDRTIQNLICPQCLCCGSYFVNVNFFCDLCQNFLNQKINICHENLENMFDVVTLINWPPGESDSLSELIYLLKSPFSGPAWRWYSACFLNHACEDIQTTCAFKSTLFIPVPGSHKKSYHTLHFAKFLSLLSGGEFRVVLKKQVQRNETSSQKSLKKRDRKSVSFEILEDFTLCLQQYENIILVDDVITTGATVKSCYNTLKPHLKLGANVTVFSLFKRESLEK